VRGILAKLDAIAALDPAYVPFTLTIRDLAARFQLDALSNFLEKPDVPD